MAEIKKFWMVRDMLKLEHLFEDPILKTDAERVGQLMGDQEGMSIHKIVRIYMGTGQDLWEKENTKLYDDAASAKKDAEARLKKARAKYEKLTKQGSADPLVRRVASRFKDV